jgi:hypothetical protein
MSETVGERAKSIDVGYAIAIDMVLSVIGSMYNEYDQITLEELKQRIV